MKKSFDLSLLFPRLVLINADMHVCSHPYCTHKLSSGKRAPFLCGVEINRIRDFGDLGGIIHLCIREGGSSGDDQKRML